MLKILGITDAPCDWTGETKNVVQFKASPGTLSGNICWAELLKIVTRKTQEAMEAKKRESANAQSTGKAVAGAQATQSREQAL